jgi:hypothetical protein
MKTPITPEALIEMGFEQNGKGYYHYNKFGIEIDVYLIPELLVEVNFGITWHSTNATTIEDIKDLIRLFK